MAGRLEKLGKKCVIGTILVLSAATAADEIYVPTKTQAACEKLLIWSGLYTPQTRAFIHHQSHLHVEGQYLIRVPRTDGKSTVTYRRSDRDLGLLREGSYYPPQLLSLDYYRGKKVLDLACGDGSLVEQLRREGIDAVGLDVHLNTYQKSKPYFVQARAHDTGLPDQSAEVIVATEGPITYLDGLLPMSADVDYVRKVLVEMHRILKPGGTLLISALEVTVRRQYPGTGFNFEKENVDPNLILKDTIYTDLPKGLRIKSAPDANWIFGTSPDSDFSRNGDGGSMMSRYWLELERTD